MASRTYIKFGTSFLFFTSVSIFLGVGPTISQYTGLSLDAFCQINGYKIINETLTTTDGYILMMHRIKYNEAENKVRRPPVLLMHGLLGSSVDYIAAGHNNSLAFSLVDQGYDVWLGNNRGNTYSRNHVTLNADTDSSFWNFSFHEMGTIDIPAMIDYIIARTNYKKIFYVGMSQGCVAYLVMTTVRPEYNEKIWLSNVIAPVITLYKSKNIFFKLWSMFDFIIQPILNVVGHQEFLGTNMISTNIGRALYNSPHTFGKWIYTEIIMKEIMGSSDDLNYDMLPFYVPLTPAGASSKQLAHYGQNRKTGDFCQYDYYDKNQERYNQTTPPIYNLINSIAPLAVYYSSGDEFCNEKILHQQLRTMPNVVLKYKVPSETFNHIDFITSKDLDKFVNNRISDMMNKYIKK